jgi:NarL family two-component system response regulator LiaR
MDAPILQVDTVPPVADVKPASLNPVRLMIVDDHEPLRRTLGLFLEQYETVELVGEASSGPEALEVCHRIHPDVVLMDLFLPGMDGIMAMRAIRREHPDVQVIGMTGMELGPLRPAVLQAGASSLLYKGALHEGLMDAIAVAARVN